MGKQPPRYYWDAAAWIAYIRKEMPASDNAIKEPRFEMCREVLERAERGEVEIVTSAFTLAEVCKKRGETRGPQREGRQLENDFLKHPAHPVGLWL